MPDTLPNEVARFHLRDRLMRVEWARRRPVMTALGWSLYVDPEDMPTWFAWVRRERNFVVVSTETWLILSGSSDALARFIDDIVHWPKDGLIYLPVDGVYAEAGLAYSKASGHDVVRAKDAIMTLEERAERLLAHSSDLVGAPRDPATHQRVVSELALVAEDLADLERRMTRLRAVVDLAKIQAQTHVA